MRSFPWRRAVLSFFPALAAAGCSTSTGPTGPEPIVHKGLVVEQRLLDETGAESAAFGFGKNVAYEITVWNDTGMDQPWTSGGEPRATFAVLSDSTAFGLPVLAGEDLTTWGVLSSGETITFRGSWKDHAWNPPLPPGAYAASLRLGMSFDSLGVAMPEASIPFTVQLPEGADNHIFSMLRTSQGEFCPKEGLYSATVVHASDGGYVLLASRLERGETPCTGEESSFGCFVQIPYLTRPLNAVELRRFRRILGDFPTIEPRVSASCTACQETFYLLRGGRFRVGPCVTGPEDYRSRMGDLEDFLEEILEFQPPPPF